MSIYPGSADMAGVKLQFYKAIKINKVSVTLSQHNCEI